MNFKISVGDFSGKNKYILNLFEIPERAGIDKIRLADLLKIHLGVELDPQDGKSSRERETASFCSRLTPSSKTRTRQTIKIETEILLKSMLFLLERQSDKCHFLSLDLSTLCYALMNSIVPYTNQVLPLLEQLCMYVYVFDHSPSGLFRTNAKLIFR